MDSIFLNKLLLPQERELLVSLETVCSDLIDWLANNFSGPSKFDSAKAYLDTFLPYLYGTLVVHCNHFWRWDELFAQCEQSQAQVSKCKLIGTYKKKTDTECLYCSWIGKCDFSYLDLLEMQGPHGTLRMERFPLICQAQKLMRW